ncbi:hypothetical protein DSM112329_00320 [Paraconexibacter sp. AEG42_29]|uniref:MmcQ/YjbR family DNA-binding protein n=1 Tax=Paraconexibacter sp. AEG42_29 TaxID=2997339 RepID=A0AAU7APA4_9ACTN
MADVALVRRLALALPSVTERSSYGTPGFRVRDRLFARIHDDGEQLVAWVADLEEKEQLLEAAPGVYTTTAHYDGHASVLVRLDAVSDDELSEALEQAWLARAPKRLRDEFLADR